MNADAEPAAEDSTSRRLALYRTLAAHLGYDAAFQSQFCTCFHHGDEHVDAGTGPCAALDSYGQPCECLSFERDTSWDEDEDDEGSSHDTASRSEGTR